MYLIVHVHVHVHVHVLYMNIALMCDTTMRLLANIETPANYQVTIQLLTSPPDLVNDLSGLEK